MNPALVFLLRRSAANAFRSKIRRLKSPRYLVPTLLGAAYFIFIFGRGEIFGRRGGYPGAEDPAASLFSEWAITAGILLMASLSWILPVRGVPLAFLESEVAQLFPAPVSRKDLVRYKLLDLQRYMIFIPLFVGLMNVADKGVLRAAFLGLGSWLTFNALSLHGIGAKMTRLSLAEHGWSGLRRSLLPLGVVGAYLGFIALTLPPLPEFHGIREVRADLGPWLSLLSDSPAGVALFPVRLLVRPFFSEGVAECALRAGGLGVLLVVLYLWVIRTDVAFEEAAAAQSETLARRIEDAKKGRITTGEVGKPPRKNPFPLSPTGPPEAAFAWKSVAELLRGMSPRLLVFVLMGMVIAVPVSLDFAKDRGDAGTTALTAVSAAMVFIAGILVFVGPAMIGVNLRQDMERVEVLKTFPLSGARLVRCSLAGTVVPIAALQAILVIGAALAFPSSAKAEITPGWRVAAAFAGILGLPALTAASSCVDAALVLWFPSWVKPGQPAAQGGVEGMGYGMLTGIGKMASLGFALLPAAPGIVLAAVGAKLAGPLWAPAFVMAGAVVGTAGIAGEAWLLSVILGRRFDRFDPAEEGLVA